jgi:ribosomal protein S18 acetylase RimI-like enzyme
MAIEQFDLQFRFATIEDVPAMVSLLAEDVFGAHRENLEPSARTMYELAFQNLSAQQGNQLLLAVRSGEVVAMLQLTIIHGLSHQGATRAQVEAVRVKSSARNQRIGKCLFAKAFEISKQAGCDLVQLTTDRRRDDAVRFYESLGFEPTHFGMKLAI